MKKEGVTKRNSNQRIEYRGMSFNIIYIVSSTYAAYEQQVLWPFP